MDLMLNPDQIVVGDRVAFENEWREVEVAKTEGGMVTLKLTASPGGDVIGVCRIPPFHEADRLRVRSASDDPVGFSEKTGWGRDAGKRT